MRKESEKKLKKKNKIKKKGEMIKNRHRDRPLFLFYLKKNDEICLPFWKQ